MATEDLVKGAVDPIIKIVERSVAFGLVDPGPLAELAFGMLVLVLMIVVHGRSMGRTSRRFARSIARMPVDVPFWRVNMLMGVTISLLALTHLIETLIWAAPITVSGLIPNFRDSYYFILETHTTLGDASIDLPDAWWLVGPMIAISGLFTVSRTGSVLVHIVGETGRRHVSAAAGPTDPQADRPAKNGP